MTGTTCSIFSLVFLIGSINAVAAVHPKIIGGDNAVIKDFPYQVSLRVSGEHNCGGAIISKRHILTAAHCFDHYSQYDVVVHSGTSRSDKEGTVHQILAVRIHPDYDKYDLKIFNDIAVITLEDPIVFNKYQQKINLPKHDIQKYQVADVTGWGRTSKEDYDTPAQLQKLRVVLLPVDKCKPFVSREIRKEQVCSFRSVGTGPCHGDSGGPLVSNGEIVGIVSYVEAGICASDIPTVYTNVFAYKDFIESVMDE